MIRSRLCFVAEGVTMDHETREVSAFRIQEALQAKAYPAPAPNMTFFCLLEREGSDASACPGEFTITVDRQQLVHAKVQIDFLGFPRCRLALRIEGMTVTRPGALSFKLAIPGHDNAEYSLRAEVASGTARRPSAGTPAPAEIRIATGEVRVR